eukprot:g453.t1
MSDIDYVAMGRAPQRLLSPLKAAAGLVGLSLAGMAGFLHFNRKETQTPSQGERFSVNPGGPGILQLVGVGEEKPACLFSYTNAMDKTLAAGASILQGWVHGARLNADNKAAYPTGQYEDVIAGKLLCWPPQLFREKVGAYRSQFTQANAKNKPLKEGVVEAIQSDASTRSAYWFYTTDASVPTKPALDTSLGTTLSWWLSSGPLPGPQTYIPDDDAGRNLTIILTGASSGIGRKAAAKMVARGHTVILACRDEQTAERVRKEVMDEVGKGAGVGVAYGMACDLGSLESVRAFAERWQRPGPHKGPSGELDLLALNAGLSVATNWKGPPPRTADGFELTIGTNHLGHFLLANLLMPELLRCESGQQALAAAKSGWGKRLVITASAVHDPDVAGGNVGQKASLGNLAGLETSMFEMVDGAPFNADKAYKDSKLCNILFMKEAARRFELCHRAGPDPSVVALSPGLIPRSGLFRNQSGLFVNVFSFITYNIARVAETVEFGGDCLLAACLGPSLGGRGANGQFWTNSKPGKHTFEPIEVSVEGRDKEKARNLWALSETLVGLPASSV